MSDVEQVINNEPTDPSQNTPQPVNDVVDTPLSLAPEAKEPASIEFFSIYSLNFTTPQNSYNFSPFMTNFKSPEDNVINKKKSTEPFLEKKEWINSFKRGYNSKNFIVDKSFDDKTKMTNLTDIFRQLNIEDFFRESEDDPILDSDYDYNIFPVL